MINISVKLEIKMHISLFPHSYFVLFLNCICISHWCDSSLRHKHNRAMNCGLQQILAFAAVMSTHLHYGHIYFAE